MDLRRMSMQPLTDICKNIGYNFSQTFARLAIVFYGNPVK